MTKHIMKEDSEFDLLKEVEKSPRLTRYVIHNKVTETKKNAVIVGIIAGAIMFACGFVVGFNFTNLNQTRNIVEVQVNKD